MRDGGRIGSGLRVLTPADCDAQPVRPYIVKGLIARGEHVELIGQPGAGKSVAGPHLAYAVAQGRPVFGLRTRQSRVLYIAAEDGHGMMGRVRALRGRHGDAPDFYLAPDGLDLLNSAESRKAVEALVIHLDPGLVVLDTLARAFPGLKENESDSMGQVVRNVRDLIAVSGAALMVLHHVAKDGGETPRGHGSLGADADTILVVAGSGADPRTVTVVKNRSGPAGQCFAFGIVSHLLGDDEDGDPITVPVAEEEQRRAPITAAARREAKLSPKNADLLRQLRVLQPAAVPVEPGEGAPTVSGITRELLRNALIQGGWFPESLLQAAPNSDKPNRSGNKTENHALTALRTNAIIGFSREFVWLL